jgi:hypothetical protein
MNEENEIKYPEGFICLNGNLKGKWVKVTYNEDFFKMISKFINKSCPVVYPKQFYGDFEVVVCVRDDVSQPITIEIYDK